MYNLRYHITSLVSVFLALALGLVLGGLIVEQGTFERQQGALVEGLQQEFADLREANRELSTENTQLDALSADFIDAWGAERLEGRVIGVVTNAGREDGLTATREAIEQAGGEVVVITLLVPSFGLDDPDLGAEVASLAPDPERAESSIAASVVAEWAAPAEERPLTEALSEAGVLSVDGLAPDGQLSGLVDIAAPEGEADGAGLTLAEEMDDLGVRAIGAQTPAVDTGVALAAAGRGLSALDTISTTVGRYSLVALLSGAEPGFYGTAESAVALFPEVVLP